MIDDLKDAVDEGVFVLVGNHDRLNERAPAHALEFLRPYVTLIDEVEFDGKLGLTFFPYFHDPDELRSKLMGLPKGLTLVMHQGVKSAVADGYPFDKTAIDAADVAGMRVISGHYHRRQTIELPDGGKWDYVGNPYTLNFGEASEPEKGFQVLYDDGSLKFVPTNLRKHVVIDRSTEENFAPVDIKNGDLVWLKLHGPADKLARLDKQRIAKAHGIPGPFRLDLIPDKVEATATEQAVATLTQGELLDEMIGSLQVDETTKQRLRPLWKELAK
jgi:DNA repair exonuclease SbcCD nuclease subunit